MILEIAVGILGIGTLLATLFIGLWVGERRRGDVLVRVLENRQLDDGTKHKAKVSYAPDAEEEAMKDISRRSIDKIAMHIADEGGVSMKRAKEEAERIAAGAESFGGDGW